MARNPSLSQRLARAFSVVGVLIAATLIVTGTCFAIVLGHYEPAVHALLSARRAVAAGSGGASPAPVIARDRP